MIEMMCAGFGGQGALSSGRILAEAGMKLGKTVTWSPSYGSEMRGGVAECMIKFSDKPIANPCARHLDILIALNGPAIDKFEERLKPSGLLLVNSSSSIGKRTYRDDIRVVAIPAADIAAKCDNLRGTNIVMMGALAANSDLFKPDELERLINEFFEKKGKNNPKNSLCFKEGAKIKETSNK